MILTFQDTLDAVENLIKKHEAFEKSAATQEERFAALEKLTSVSIKKKDSCWHMYMYMCTFLELSETKRYCLALL